MRNMFNILLVYLDDIDVYSNTLDEHLTRLDTVFTRLGSYGLKLEIKKCSFFQKSVKYLGHVVSGEGVATDPDKITAGSTGHLERPTIIPRICVLLPSLHTNVHPTSNTAPQNCDSCV